MESCTICCFPFEENDTSGVTKSKKVLCCHHYLCESCFLRLEYHQCPFCRLSFTYTDEELMKRKSLNLEYYKWQPPSPIYDYIPSENPITSFTNRVRNRNRNRNRNRQLNIVTVPDTPISDIISPTQTNITVPSDPFSRVQKNMQRRRRRDLCFEEVLERREMIKKRSNLKWTKKNERLYKETGHLTEIESI